MDLITEFRIASTILMCLIFAGIVWWAVGGRRRTRFDAAAHSVLHDDDALDSIRSVRRAK